MLEFLLNNIALIIAGLIILFVGIPFILKGFHSINENEIGIVKKNFLFYPFRKRLPNGQQVAPNGEPGYQATILPQGLRWRLPFKYQIIKEKITIIKRGEIGIVHAKYGLEKPKGRNFPPVIECDHYQDAKTFLLRGGCKGTQLDVLTEGNWSINHKLFTITIQKACEIKGGSIGIVETKDGKELKDEIAGDVILGHNNFRDANEFINKGGYMGKQIEILREGLYEINPFFAEVKIVPVTHIEEGTVGVLNSFVGKEPSTNSEDKLVDEGFKGVQRKVLTNKIQPINTDIAEVFHIPTQQITLEWNNDESKLKGDYDANLKPISLTSSDLFTFSIPLTQTIVIKPENAPRLIKAMGISSIELVDDSSKISTVERGQMKKYGAVKLFISRILEPKVKETFTQIASKYSALDFYNQQGTISRSAEDSIKEQISFYGVDAVQTVIHFMEFPEDLKGRINIIHMSQEFEERKILETKEKDFEIEMTKKDEERKLLIAKGDADAIITKYGSVDKYLEHQRMILDKDKANPGTIVYAPGGGLSGGNGNDILGLKDKVFESLNIGTSTTNNQNLIVSDDELKKKAIETASKKKNKQSTDNIIESNEE